MTDFLTPMFDQLDQMPKCFGCEIDDFVDAVADDHVTAFRLDHVPVTNAFYLLDPREREETSDDL